MKYLLDTNVVSEPTRPQPDPGVVAWLADADEDLLYLSVITLAELRLGVARLTDGIRHQRLARWLEIDLPQRFAGRLLAIDQVVADQWGKLMAATQRAGHTMGAMDAFIAASAMCYGCTLVTRNVKDFAAIAVPVMNPWAT